MERPARPPGRLSFAGAWRKNRFPLYGRRGGLVGGQHPGNPAHLPGRTNRPGQRPRIAGDGPQYHRRDAPLDGFQRNQQFLSCGRAGWFSGRQHPPASPCVCVAHLSQRLPEGQSPWTGELEHRSVHRQRDALHGASGHRPPLPGVAGVPGRGFPSVEG